MPVLRRRREVDDPWADERTGRVWIQGDLHAENFGTYMDSAGALVFDVNDFDEAYLGHFGRDLGRMAASLALLAGALGRLDQGDQPGKGPGRAVRVRNRQRRAPGLHLLIEGRSEALENESSSP